VPRGGSRGKASVTAEAHRGGFETRPRGNFRVKTARSRGSDSLSGKVGYRPWTRIAEAQRRRWRRSGWSGCPASSKARASSRGREIAIVGGENLGLFEKQSNRRIARRGASSSARAWVKIDETRALPKASKSPQRGCPLEGRPGRPGPESGRSGSDPAENRHQLAVNRQRAQAGRLDRDGRP
jgi:hypothetical protein